jgi:uncharacterized membrane protein
VNVDLLVAGALFFFCYPIVVGLILSRRRNRDDELYAQIVAIRREVADLQARVAKAGAPGSAAQDDYRPSSVAKESPPVPGPPANEPASSPDPEPRAISRTIGDAPMPTPAAASSSAPEPKSSAPRFPVIGAPKQPQDTGWLGPQQTADVHRAPPKPPAPPPAWLVAAKRWLFSGNLVAKFGLLILFIGVSFLLKYAAERVTIPIEVRLAAVVLADIALLAFGWRIRSTRRGIGLPVQGAAIAILMLVVFGVFQRYQLISAGPAFATLFILTAFTCLLAVLQDAVWLAVFGISGGFAAPLMISTGQGNHIGLFSYYAVLNAGILAIALKRSWRVLNLLGFVFTFIIGTAWGVLKYSPDNYASAQAFLILYLAFYVGLAVAYAARQAPQMKHYVDATLVFATPVFAIGLQYALVRDKPFGMALSALSLGLFYTALALVLWRRQGANWKLLTESFLAMGVVFGTLALPFAFDQRWTSGAWALEGAGIVWIGLRQKSVLTWMFGLLVQGGAWISFFAALAGLDTGAAANSNLWLGFLLLAGAAFAMAVNFRSQNGETASFGFTKAANLFLAFAALWLLGGAWAELIVNAERLGASLGTLLVASAMVTAILLALLARALRWQLARGFALIAQLLGGAAMLYVAMFRWGSFAGADRMLAGALMICAGALFSGWTIQRTMSDRRGRVLAGLLLGWAGSWWFGPILSTVAEWSAPVVSDRFGLRMSYDLTYLIGVALSAIGFARAAKRFNWPAMRILSATSWLVLTLTTCVLLFLIYADNHTLPAAQVWVTYACLWLASEYLLTYWPAQGWTIHPRIMKLLHGVRIVGPWMMIWPVGTAMIGGWLLGDQGVQQELLARAGWHVSGSWAQYLSAWMMMAALFWLNNRSHGERWPTTPVAAWHRRVLIPLGIAWSLLLVVAWNLGQNGAMAPLPYLPLVNPLDMTTGFASLLAVNWYRTLQTAFAHSASAPAALLSRIPRFAKFAAYAWFNLMLLRTAAQWLGIDYRFDALMSSQVVQSMLSLTWCVTALIVMRRAGDHDNRPARRRQWLTGAALLGVVVAKLFIADLANVGSMGRIVSFVGVGVLMLVIGYLAPFPAASTGTPEPVPA